MAVQHNTVMDSWLLLLLILLSCLSCHLDARRLTAIPHGQKTEDLKQLNSINKHSHSQTHADMPTFPDLISHRILPDGEEEIRVVYRGVVAMETVLREGQENKLFYREVSNGRRVVKMVYASRDELVDCDVQKEEGALARFFRRFLGEEVKDHPADNHLPLVPLDGGWNPTNTASHLRLLGGELRLEFLGKDDTTPERYSHLVNMDGLVEACRIQHHLLREELRESGKVLHPRLFSQAKLEESRESQQREVTAQMSSTETEIDNNLYKDEVNWSEVEGYLKQKSSELFPAEELPNSNSSSIQHHRSKRFMRYPDTKWCGKGDVAETYEDLGESQAADECCRAHDHCPDYIESFDYKFNYFNFGLHTLSHCKCDLRFRRCLRRASRKGKPAAEMIGKIFFNVLGQSCFRLRKEKVCVEKSWWGTCLKYKRQRAAHIQDAVVY